MSKNTLDGKKPKIKAGFYLLIYLYISICLCIILVLKIYFGQSSNLLHLLLCDKDVLQFRKKTQIQLSYFKLG